MASGLGERAVLAPARHPAVDQPGVARSAFGGTEAQPLHHTWAIALDQGVGLGDQRQSAHLAVGRLQVYDLDCLAAV